MNVCRSEHTCRSGDREIDTTLITLSPTPTFHIKVGGETVGGDSSSFRWSRDTPTRGIIISYGSACWETYTVQYASSRPRDNMYKER